MKKRGPATKLNQEKIASLYRDGLNGTEIGKIVGCTRATVYQRLKIMGIPRRTRGSSLHAGGLKKRISKARKCENCGKEFITVWWTKKNKKSSGRGQKFCSTSCYMDFAKFSMNNQDIETRVSAGGYKYKTIHKGMHVYEHRYVVEQYLGRRLIKGEQVHHLDGDKQNNDITNLVVVRTGEHWLITRLQHFKALTRDFKKIMLDILKKMPTREHTE